MIGTLSHFGPFCSDVNRPMPHHDCVLISKNSYTHKVVALLELFVAFTFCR